MAAIDLDAAKRVINRPHIIELREDGWTLMHPPACHPNLFACPLSRAATRDLKGAPKPSEMGEFFCDLRENGRLRIGERAPDSEGIDWAALVAELRAARESVQALQDFPALQPGHFPVLEAWRNELVVPALAAYDQAIGTKP